MTEDNNNINETKLEYYCKICEYDAKNSNRLRRHLLTKRHDKQLDLLTNKIYSKKSSASEINIFNCNCGKQYKSKAGFNSHKKQCVNIVNNNTDNTVNSINNVNKFNHDEINSIVDIDDNDDYQTFIEKVRILTDKQQKQIDKTLMKIKDNNETVDNIKQKINFDSSNNTTYSTTYDPINNVTTNTAETTNTTETITNRTNNYNIQIYVNDFCSNDFDINKLIFCIQEKLSTMDLTNLIQYQQQDARQDDDASQDDDANQDDDDNQYNCKV
jgi:hypothetical protein